MEFKIVLPFKAYSINDYYYNNRKFGKRKEAKDWEYQVNWQLKNYDFSEFRSKFDPKTQAFKVDITYYYDNFYNKTGTLNKKIYDLSNCEKPLLDLIFNPAQHGPPPYKSPNLNIDDSNIIEMNVKKCHGQERVEVVITMLELNANTD